MNIVTLCAVALVCACACLLIKETGQKETAILLGGVFLAGCTLLSLQKVGEPVKKLLDMFSGSGAEVYTTVLFKTFGVAFITDISADAIRGFGSDAIARGVETAGKAEMLLLSVPAVTELLSLSAKLLGQA